MTPTAAFAASTRRQGLPSATLAMVALAGLALWLAPGLQASAVDAVAHPKTLGAGSFSLLPPAPWVDGAKLLLAAAIGALISGVQRFARRDLPLSRSMAQTYVLLCVAGALTMTMIGDSLPRAFAVGGAASIVKFRTPVDDPRDGSALFLLLGLGMACGVGSFGVAIMGALFLAGCLFVLNHQIGGDAPRSMRVAVVADSAYNPARIIEVFTEHHIRVEPLEISHGEQTVIRYRAVMSGERKLEEVSQRLMDGGTTGVRSVSWEAPKRWM